MLSRVIQGGARCAVRAQTLQGGATVQGGAAMQGVATQAVATQAVATQGAAHRVLAGLDDVNALEEGSVKNRVGAEQSLVASMGASMRAPTEHIQQPLLKAHIVIKDLSQLQAARGLLPKGHSIADSMLTSLRSNTSDDYAAFEHSDDELALSQALSCKVSEFVRDPKTGAVHLLTAEIAAKDVKGPVWKIHADDAPPQPSQPDVQGEYFCIEAQSPEHPQIIDKLRGIQDLPVLRELATQDALIVKK